MKYDPLGLGMPIDARRGSTRNCHGQVLNTSGALTLVSV